MRNIETFPSKQMYPYLSLVERKVAEFYHNIERRRWLVWLKWLTFMAFSGQFMVSLLLVTTQTNALTNQYEQCLYVSVASALSCAHVFQKVYYACHKRSFYEYFIIWLIISSPSENTHFKTCLCVFWDFPDWHKSDMSCWVWALSMFTFRKGVARSTKPSPVLQCLWSR